MTTEEYNKNYTIDEIQNVLNDMRDCIADKRRTFLCGEDREKNAQFDLKFQLKQSDKDKILLRLNVMDFVGALKSRNEKHENEVLYVFVPKEKLRNYNDKLIEIEIYIKFSISGTNKKMQTIVISLHELEHPVEYAFRNNESEKKEG